MNLIRVLLTFEMNVLFNSMKDPVVHRTCIAPSQKLNQRFFLETRSQRKTKDLIMRIEKCS